MTVSFQLSPEQEQLKLGARQFSGEHLRPPIWPDGMATAPM